ncbi:hypothetical protein G6F31_021806 [Rhizopus arrhizus]|nr:hypothetical protein G6F31_021806 [Rhizopus arrhizus]
MRPPVRRLPQWKPSASCPSSPMPPNTMRPAPPAARGSVIRVPAAASAATKAWASATAIRRMSAAYRC